MIDFDIVELERELQQAGKERELEEEYIARVAARVAAIQKGEAANQKKERLVGTLLKYGWEPEEIGSFLRIPLSVQGKSTNRFVAKKEIKEEEPHNHMSLEDELSVMTDFARRF